MKENAMKQIVACCGLSLIMLPSIAYAADDCPWDLDELFQAPQWETTDKGARPGVTSVLYSSIPVNGNPVQVFAYYGAPKGDAPEGGWPAVVCVHGGGGTAMEAWVKKWNDHGYAAISMDLEGNHPADAAGGSRRSRRPTEHPGLKRLGIFKTFAEPLERQWYYHAVAQVVIAHSLLRSFPEVNADKTGLTGISWGGTLTSTTMGVDPRFKFAIPVYGCGFIPPSDGNQGLAIKPGRYTEVVNNHFDGSAYFSNVKIPTLWVNGTNDSHFPMPSTQLSAQAVRAPATLRFQLRMPHGHGAGWRPEEIYAFADSVVKDGKPLVQFGAPAVKGDRAVVEFSSATGLTKSEFLYTLDATAWPKRLWQSAPAAVTGSTITATMPEGAVAFYFNATDERGFMTSSEFVMVGQDASPQVQDYYPNFDKP